MKRWLCQMLLSLLIVTGVVHGQELSRTVAGWLLSSPLTSAQLAAGITDETGTGLAVFATSPTLTTPVIGTMGNGASPINIIGTIWTGLNVGQRVGATTLSGFLTLDSTSGAYGMQNNTGDLLFYGGGTVAVGAGTEFMRLKSTGQVLLADLKTTGAATGKKVVCVDTTTGQLYASTSGVACAN